MAVSLNSVVGFNSTLRTKYQHVSKPSNGAPLLRAISFTSSLEIYGSRKTKIKRRLHSISNSDLVATDDKGSGNAERQLSDNQFSAVHSSSSDSSAGSSQFQASSTDKLGSQTPEDATGSRVSSDTKPNKLSSPELQSKRKGSPLTAREKLRAARVLSRDSKPKASKAKLGNSVIDALRESDRGKKRSGLPEAPTNLLDDSKRGMPKSGLTFDFPGGADLFFIVFSFVFISTVMFATTYFVWKIGAIHFNE